MADKEAITETPPAQSLSEFLATNAARETSQSGTPSGTVALTSGSAPSSNSPSGKFPEVKAINRTGYSPPVGSFRSGTLEQMQEQVVLTCIVIRWKLTKMLPSVDFISQYTNVPAPTVEYFLDHPEFQAKLTAKGVPIPGTPSDFLSVEQIQTIAVIVDPSSNKTLEQRLKSIQIDFDTYHNWLRQPTFNSTLKALTNGILEEHLPNMLVALAAKASSGDMKAIEFAFEVSGYYRKGAESTNAQEVLVRIMEVLMVELKDSPDKLARISAALSPTGGLK